MQELVQYFDQLLGITEGVGSLTLSQVALRAVLIYVAGYVMLRVGEHRFLGKNTAFDIVLGFIFGTTLSRAINGTAPFFDTIAAGAILLGLHWIFATLTARSDRLNVLLNGKAVQIIKDGTVKWDAMRRQRITERLLMENVRTNAHLADLDAVQEAYYERSGNISVIPRRDPVRIVEVKVKEGVQTVRLLLEG